MGSFQFGDSHGYTVQLRNYFADVPTSLHASTHILDRQRSLSSVAHKHRIGSLAGFLQTRTTTEHGLGDDPGRGEGRDGRR